jgi:hypothetical protein
MDGSNLRIYDALVQSVAGGVVEGVRSLSWKPHRLRLATLRKPTFMTRQETSECAR